jgi:hypothetical protein
MPHGYAGQFAKTVNHKDRESYEKTVRVNAFVILGAPGFMRFAGCVLGIAKREEG